MAVKKHGIANTLIDQKVRILPGCHFMPDGPELEKHIRDWKGKHAGSGHLGDSGTVRAIYQEGKHLMAIVWLGTGELVPCFVEHLKMLPETQPLKVFITTAFHGLYPVGTAAYAVAANKEDALRMFEAEIDNHKLRAQNPDYLKPEDLLEIDASKPESEMLLDGNY